MLIFVVQTHNNKWIHRRMYFPGNEIPKWFRYQRMGSSVTLEMPPTGFFSNKKLMGFAVCAIVAFRDQHHDSDSRYSGHYEHDRKDNLYSLDCTWKVKSEGCYRDLRSWYFGTISSYVRSEHVFLGYYLFDSVELGKYYDEVNQASFEIHRLIGERLGCCEVKKCGIHFVHAQDSTE